MFKSGSTKLVKNLNQRHILNLVRIHPYISAGEIRKKTGLQMSTVAYTLKELEKDGFICKVGMGTSKFQGGKPPVLWDLCPRYGFIMGMELMPAEIRLTILDFSTKVIFKKIYQVDILNNVEQIVSQVCELVDTAVKEANIKRELILGLGIGVPGFLDPKRGLLKYSYTFGLRDVLLMDLLQAGLEFPVKIANDANVGALGIKWLSRSEQMVPNILYATINQSFLGLGLGMIINHELYEGSSGFSGEVKGFMQKSKRRSIIAQAESKFGSGSDTIRMLKKLENGQTPVTVLADQAGKGEEPAIYILQEIAKIIGKELARIVDILAPDIIIIGGDICMVKEYVLNIIADRVAKMILADFTEPTPVQFSPFGVYSVAIGSTALIFRQIFNSY